MILVVATGSLARAAVQFDRQLASDGNTVLLLHLNEGEGTPRDSSTSWQTISVGGALWTEEGKFGAAMRFEDAAAQVHDDPAFRMSDEMTIECWVRPSAAALADQNYHIIVTKHEANPSESDSRLRLALLEGKVSAHGGLTGRTTLEPDKWYHIAYVVKGTYATGGREWIFINGVLDAEAPTLWRGVTQAGNLNIGGRAEKRMGGLFNGLIDELRVSNVARDYPGVKGERGLRAGLNQIRDFCYAYDPEPTPEGQVDMLHRKLVDGHDGCVKWDRRSAVKIDCELRTPCEIRRVEVEWWRNRMGWYMEDMSLLVGGDQGYELAACIETGLTGRSPLNGQKRNLLVFDDVGKAGHRLRLLAHGRNICVQEVRLYGAPGGAAEAGLAATTPRAPPTQGSSGDHPGKETPPLDRFLALVSGGEAVSTIVVAESADPWTQMAARWLREYVELATGVRLPAMVESGDAGGALISVGHTKMAASAGITVDELKYDGGKMVVKGNVLYLIGRDSPVHGGAMPNWPASPWAYEQLKMDRTGHIGPKGTCRIVTTFLDEVCGIRWLIPTPEGVHVPRAEHIAVPVDLDETREPVFAYAHGRFFYGNPRYSPAAYANNVRNGVRIKTFGGHSYYSWLPANVWFEDHPEYFAMLNGRRSDKGNHLCTSNPEVRRILVRGLTGLFDKGYDWVQLGQSDGYQECRCSVCESLDDYQGYRRLRGESPYEYDQRLRYQGCERQHLAHKWIADTALESHPDKTILMLAAYSPLDYPSTRFDRYPDNVVPEVHGDGDPKYIEAWRGQGRGLSVSGVWLNAGMPPGVGFRYTPREAADLIRYFYDAKVIGIYYMGGGAMWGMQGPTYYVLGRMMGNPKGDYRGLVKEYCDGLYGDAAGFMLRFFRTLYSRPVYPHVSPLLETPPTAAEVISHVYRPEYLIELDGLLRRAERAAETERERMWVRLSRDEFDAVRHLATLLQLYDAYLLCDDASILAQLGKAVGTFNECRRRITAYEGDHVRLYFPGHGMLCKYLTSGINSGGYFGDWQGLRTASKWEDLDVSEVGFHPYSTIGKPLTLDLDRLRERSDHFRLDRTSSPVVIDGRMEEAEWRAAEPVHMMGNVRAEVRGLYDDEHVYFFYTCEEPRVDQMKVGPVGRDGPAFRQDCIELFLDPASASFSRTYFHFIASPVADALYDEAIGLKAGNDRDTSYDAASFRYGFQVAEEEECWTIECRVAFEDLNAAPPRAGDTWMGNHGRERYTGVKALYQWSKGGMFNDPRSFGRFRFE